ncbi:MAG: hypothetical protein K940chlam9_01894 [Chlamydiae bacterium]|nr:hypothetical protein [Chlamydiota bacterium]
MFWDKHDSWEKAEAAWEKGALSANQTRPLKTLKSLPQMPGVTPKTAKNLKWKAFKYMVAHDKGRKITRHFLKHPFRYGFRYLTSLVRNKSYRIEDDFYFYGLKSFHAFEKLYNQKNTLLVVGFSYCQKPFECPSGRFTDRCIRDPENPICRQCDIGKTLHALPQERTVPLLIPTIHYIGEKVFDLVHANPKKRVLFLITACEMTLKMFGDYGNMAGVQGIGVRLDGRICNTMKAFELSEGGIKPGLTVVTPPTQEKLLGLIRRIRTPA